MSEANGMSIINSHIEKGDFSRIYLLGGEEEYLVSQYKTKLVKALTDTDDSMNYGVYKGENAKAEVIEELALTMPFFADRRVVLVEDSDFFKKGNVRIEALLEQIPETTVIVFSEHNIDKRCKLYKQVDKLGTVAMFGIQTDKTLAVWVKSLFSRENMKIDDAAVYKLIENVGSDMNTIANEAEKLKCYGIEKDSITVEDVDALSINQVEGKIFDMMDALSKRDKRTTMKLYNDLLQLKEPFMRILYLITSQYNKLLKVKLVLETGGDNGKIASVVKVPAFAVKKYVSQAQAYTYGQLVDKVNLCQETDNKIKTGAMRDSLAVEMLIVSLLQ